MTGWRNLARCRGMDTRIFYPERGETANRAKKICRRCPVREECYAESLKRQVEHGIWGGRSQRHRREIHKQEEQISA